MSKQLKELIASIRSRHPKALSEVKQSARGSEVLRAIEYLFPHSYNVDALTQTYIKSIPKGKGGNYSVNTVGTWVKVLAVYDLATDDEISELFKAFYQPKNDKDQMLYDFIVGLPPASAAVNIRKLLEPLKKWRNDFNQAKFKKAKSPEAKAETEAVRKEDWIHFRAIEAKFNERDHIEDDESELVFHSFMGAYMFSDKMLRGELCAATHDGSGNCNYSDGEFFIKETHKKKRANVTVKVRADVRRLLDALVGLQKEKGCPYLFGFKSCNEMREKLLVPKLKQHFGKTPTVNTLRSIKNTYMAQLWKVNGSEGSTRDDYIAKPFDHSADEAYQTYIFEDLFDPEMTQ
ncbi:hypothetical protein HK097_003340 [Rhizophlyctis rosea]|uniref:Uncharacterized protein n=1 Tax=Rhizophlyctis rosea TaxID=64517 RepID=A0AAD5S4A7_9FUNG|nr:hypothetical protein HK097_003340 [Rhizophlyctis rosea]